MRIITALLAIVLIAAGCSDSDSVTDSQIQQLQDRADELAENASAQANQPTQTQEALGPDAFVQLARDMQGPSDNLTEQIRQIDPDFLDIPTPTDAEIRIASSSIDYHPVTGEFITTTTFAYSTTDDIATLVESVTASLVQAFPSETFQTMNLDRLNAIRITGGEYEANAVTDGAFTTMSITRVSATGASDEHIALYDGVTAAITPPEGAILDGVSVSMFLGPPVIKVRWYFPGLTEQQEPNLIAPLIEQFPVDGVATEIDLGFLSTDTERANRGHEDGLFLDIIYNQ